MIRMLETDCRIALRDLPAASVHCCVTSPPYYGLRIYEGLEPGIWGGQAECAHVWNAERHTQMNPQQDSHGGVSTSRSPNTQAWTTGTSGTASHGQHCTTCGAWRGTLGNEPAPALYVEHMVEVFTEVWRVLHPSGTLWLNLGDSYASNPAKGRPSSSVLEGRQNATPSRPYTRPPGLKPKDLLGMPWRVVFALQAAGWWLRSAPPWIKDNGMPESATDRPGVGHEQWFLLTKRARYFWDAEAVKRQYARPYTDGPGFGGLANHAETRHRALSDQSHMNRSGYGPNAKVGTGRAYRTSDTWTDSLDALIEQEEDYLAHLHRIRASGGALLDREGNVLALKINSVGSTIAHYATFPPRVIEPLIKGGTSAKGACPVCLSPWMRVIDKEYTSGGNGGGGGIIGNAEKMTKSIPERKTLHTTTLGWRPTCLCPWALIEAFAASLPKGPRTWEYWSAVLDAALDFPRKIPCTVLDPFAGTGTVALVADRLGLDAIMIEANPADSELTTARLMSETPLFTHIEQAQR